MDEYVTISQASEKWNLGERVIITLCSEGNIDGSIKFGKACALPTTAEIPKEKRIKSGKYIKDKNLQAGGETYE